MTTLLPQLRQSAYQLSEDLRDESPIIGIRTAAPSEGEGEELLLDKLGPKGWGRVHHFRHYYSSGWGEGAGKPLSPRGLETFYRFLERVTFPDSSKPSVFLTDHGALELCWEDSAGKAVQVEFRSAEIEFFHEARQIEGTVPISQVKDLAARLSD